MPTYKRRCSYPLEFFFKKYKNERRLAWWELERDDKDRINTTSYDRIVL